MSGRRLFLDDAPGEARGVVVLDGQPERLLLARDDDLAVQAVGARVAARVRRIERGLASAFLDLGQGPDAILALSGEARDLSEGQAVEVEITAAARAAKGAVARLVGEADGSPRLLARAPDIRARLQAFASGEAIREGEAARDAADLAQDVALAVEHPLGGGASLAVETTRALVAVDVDLGGAAGGDPRRGAARVNRLALTQGARLLRLKGLGGLVVFDFAGAQLDGKAMTEAGEAAFAADMPGVGFGPLSRFGTWQLVLPWRARPVAELLRDPDGRPTAQAAALALARTIEREARHAVRVRAACAPEVAAAAEGLKPALLARLGPRFDIVSDPARARAEPDVRAL